MWRHGRRAHPRRSAQSARGPNRGRRQTMGITNIATRVGVASLAAGSVLMAPTLGMGAANPAAADPAPCDASDGESACSSSATRLSEELFGTLEAGTHTFALEE